MTHSTYLSVASVEWHLLSPVAGQKPTAGTPRPRWTSGGSSAHRSLTPGGRCHPPRCGPSPTGWCRDRCVPSRPGSCVTKTHNNQQARTSMRDERRFYLNLFHGICHDEYTRVCYKTGCGWMETAAVWLPFKVRCAEPYPCTQHSEVSGTRFLRYDTAYCPSHPSSSQTGLLGLRWWWITCIWICSKFCHYSVGKHLYVH